MACDLITRAEMAEILGAAIGKLDAENSDGKTSCTYPPGDAGSYAQAEIAIDWDHGDEPSFERQLVDAFSRVAIGRQVAHDVELGDEASYTREGVLSVRAGKTLITISLPMRPDSEEKALAIGRKLFERLGLPTTKTEAPKADPTTTDPTKAESTKTEAAEPADPVFPDGLSVGDECPEATGDATPTESALIPLAVGLTLSHTWTGSAGDYEHECLIQVVAVTPSYVDVTQSCPVGKSHEPSNDKRRLCRGDLRDSYFYRTETKRTVPPVVAGSTMFSLSQRSFRELKANGSTRHRYIEVAMAWDTTGAKKLKEDNDGTLRAGSQDRAPYTVIVNDRPVALPTIVAISHAATPQQTIAKVLDDERFPLVLDYEVPGDGFRIKFTKISFPTGGEMEKHLAVEKHVDVYGIYFDFASDRLRAESTPVLNEIAGVLAKNADWKLGINGHTDNIGGDASNLELSRRRSEAVRRALVEQYHIDPSRLATAGFGASQPKETNATIEGRGKNRRVELVRQ